MKDKKYRYYVPQVRRNSPYMTPGIVASVYPKTCAGILGGIVAGVEAIGWERWTVGFVLVVARFGCREGGGRRTDGDLPDFFAFVFVRSNEAIHLPLLH